MLQPDERPIIPPLHLVIKTAVMWTWIQGYLPSGLHQKILSKPFKIAAQKTLPLGSHCRQPRYFFQTRPCAHALGFFRVLFHSSTVSSVARYSCFVSHSFTIRASSC